MSQNEKKGMIDKLGQFLKNNKTEHLRNVLKMFAKNNRI